MSYLIFLQTLRVQLAGCFDGFFLTLTGLAESPAPFLFLAWVYWCVDKRWGQFMALGTGLNCSVGQAMKGLCRIERPWVRRAEITPVPEALGTAGGYSFPSGHTIRAGSAYGVFGLTLLREKRKKAGAACLLLFLLIAFSRNYLGVHTPEDVLAGILICAVNYYALGAALSWADRGGFRDVAVCAAACVLVFLPMLRLGCLSNCGACFGFFAGWFLERRFIDFPMPKSPSEKIARGLYGSLGVLLISTAFQTGMSKLMAGKYAGFFTGFFLSLFIMALYPAIFTRTKGRLRPILAGILSCAVFLVPLAMNVVPAQAEKPIAVIGHRGFAAAAPENTLPSFEAALALGADYVELDVQLSADGEIVVCHDANLQRVTGVDRELSSLSLEELKGLDFGAWFSPDYAGTKIPTLGEVLDLVKPTGACIYLELKDIGEDPGFPAAVLALTKEKEMTDRCVFASFQYRYLSELKTCDPDVNVLLNTDSSDISLPETYPSDYYGIKYSSFSREQADAVHASGAHVFVWTVDDPAQIADAVGKGADGICSNHPERVIEYLNSR